MQNTPSGVKLAYEPTCAGRYFIGLKESPVQEGEERDEDEKTVD